jgi:3-deoxy-manno-octulosonate cytidylyltransferase (CMP-KDO synthetase)
MTINPALVVMVPARLGSTRLPNKPLADLGGAPLVVRVAQRAMQVAAARVVVAADAPAIVQACELHGIEALLTQSTHATGSDRLAEACTLLKLPDEACVVNVQGDEPFIHPEWIKACASLLIQHPDCSMSTVAHPITEAEAFWSPHVVKVVTDAFSRAMYFSRAPIAWNRDAPLPRTGPLPPQTNPPLRHIGLYAYRAGFLRLFTRLPASPIEGTESLEQLRALWHGHRVAVHVTDLPPGPGVDTPQDLELARQRWQQQRQA